MKRFWGKEVVIAAGIILCGLQTIPATDSAPSSTNPDASQTAGQIHAFWDWFQQIRPGYSDLEPVRAKLTPQIVDRLRQMSPHLTIEVEPLEKSVREMAISADGMKVDFPLVKQLVAAAPAMEGWRIVAFRQPMPIKGVELKFQNLTLDTDKMWIFRIENKEGFDLIIYFSDYTEGKRSEFINATYILLDSALGEYNVVMGIRTLDFKRLPPPDQRKGILPFTDLPAVFAAYQQKHRN